MNMPESTARIVSAIIISAFAVCLIGLVFLKSPPAQFDSSIYPIWNDQMPGSKSVKPQDRPLIKAFFPVAQNSNHPAIILCPGGGYQYLSIQYEGYKIAERLNKMGITVFVLNYRRAPRYFYPAPVNDVQRAIRYVRYHASKFGINPKNIGIMGFSAGGHLASTAAIHHQLKHYMGNRRYKRDAIDRMSARPDFAVLGYPIISMQPRLTHAPSAHNLFGKTIDPKLARLYSNQLHVNRSTPPMFIFHASDDEAVPVENSTLLYAALRRYKIPAELHIYSSGRHGFGLGNGKDGAPLESNIQSWPILLQQWLYEMKILKRES